MRLQKTDLPGVVIIEPDVFKDNRGLFKETYNKSKYQEIGLTEEFVQDNYSWSAKNTIRGLQARLGPAN